MQLDIKSILERLPHRYPMLLIDRVLEMVPGKSIKALKMSRLMNRFSSDTFRIIP